MDQSGDFIEVRSDWYSPRRLLSSPTGHHSPPGDRFVPNRSLMDLDRAHSLLTNGGASFAPSRPNKLYQKKLVETLSLDSDGRPFQMLVFRGSPKSAGISSPLLQEIRRNSGKEEPKNLPKQNPKRCFPEKEERILDAPNLRDDYYMNIIDWGKNNILALALGPETYLWDSNTQIVQKLERVPAHDDYPTSICWSQDATNLAIGNSCSKIELWDAETLRVVRNLEGHSGRIAVTSWNRHILTSGSDDKSIINHDVRAANSLTSRIKVHKSMVCGLKWSLTGNSLASGGNDNLLYIWEASKMSSSHFLHRFNGHRAAVKALAWCPYQYEVLASGGGMTDGSIKLWNIQKGACISSLDTNAQICGLQWNKHHKEIASGHGYSLNSSQNQNKLSLWKYPSMVKVGEFGDYTSRAIDLCQSPDGLTVALAVADCTLRLWNIFGPPNNADSKLSLLDGLLSLKMTPIR